MSQQEESVYLGADQIAKQIAPAAPEGVRIEAGREFLRRIKAYLKQGKSLIVETTLSGLSMRRIIQNARQNGYLVAIVFIFTETEDLCVERVAQRVLKGGHDVPEPDIRRRYKRSQERFWALYRKEADEWHLVYNVVDQFILVATGEGSNIEVSNQECFDLFTKSGT